MGAKERFEKHRKDAMITCDEDCLCWDIEIMAMQIAALEAAVKEKDERLHSYEQYFRGDDNTLIDGMNRQIAALTTENKRLKAALGSLGLAADLVHKEKAIIQPFLDVFIKHGAIIAECMEAALAGKETGK